MKKMFSNIGIRASILTIIINFILFVFKLVAGLVSNSNAMVSDAFHSLSDVLTTIVVIFGLIISSKEADDKHPYGHERVESVFAIILSFVLFLTGISIGYIGIESIIKRTQTNLAIPGVLALIAAIVSIVVKEGMYQYTKRVAKKINSTSMEADAWHHRSDALSSVGSFIGILGARFGFPILDPLCSIVICILIIKSAIEIFMGAVSQMLDVACPTDIKEEIYNAIIADKDVIKIDDFKTRMFGNKVYVDVDVKIDGSIPLNDANIIVERIHDNIEKTFNIVKHCNVHILPN